MGLAGGVTWRNSDSRGGGGDAVLYYMPCANRGFGGGLIFSGHAVLRFSIPRKFGRKKRLEGEEHDVVLRAL